MTDCREVLDHLSEFLDEELPPGTCAEIAAHLSSCTECDEERWRLLRSIEICREYSAGESPRELPPQVREELRTAFEKVRSRMHSREVKE